MPWRVDHHRDHEGVPPVSDSTPDLRATGTGSCYRILAPSCLAKKPDCDSECAATSLIPPQARKVPTCTGDRCTHRGYWNADDGEKSSRRNRPTNTALDRKSVVKGKGV